MPTEKNLEAIIVKRKKVLLPKVEGDSCSISTSWVMVRNNLMYSILKGREWKINTDILIEKKQSNPFGYYLYGTDIPIRFVYPKEFAHILPDISKCIGIICNDYQISKFLYQQDTKFNYRGGRAIQDYDVIEWLENSQNVESMKYLCEYLCEYEKNVQEFMKKRTIYQEQLQRQSEESEKRKLQEKQNIIVRERNLVRQYYQA